VRLGAEVAQGHPASNAAKPKKKRRCNGSAAIQDVPHLSRTDRGLEPQFKRVACQGY
jgi:hypothetical protein